MAASTPMLLNMTLAIKVGGRDRLEKISENGIFAYRTPNSIHRLSSGIEKLPVNVADISFNVQ